MTFAMQNIDIKRLFRFLAEKTWPWSSRKRPEKERAEVKQKQEQRGADSRQKETPRNRITDPEGPTF